MRGASGSRAEIVAPPGRPAVRGGGTRHGALRRRDDAVRRERGQATEVAGAHIGAGRTAGRRVCRARPPRTESPDPARAPSARAASGHTAPLPAPAWFRQCAAARCRRRCRARRARPAHAVPARSNSPHRAIRDARPEGSCCCASRAASSAAPARSALTSARRSGTGRPAPARAATAAKRFAGQRRNGLPALTCMTTTALRGRCRSTEARVHARADVRALGHLDADRSVRSGGSMPSAASRSHWFSTEWRGRNCAAARRPACTSSLRPGTV